MKSNDETIYYPTHRSTLHSLSSSTTNETSPWHHAMHRFSLKEVKSSLENNQKKKQGYTCKEDSQECVHVSSETIDCSHFMPTAKLDPGMLMLNVRSVMNPVQCRSLLHTVVFNVQTCELQVFVLLDHDGDDDNHEHKGEWSLFCSFDASSLVRKLNVNAKDTNGGGLQCILLDPLAIVLFSDNYCGNGANMVVIYYSEWEEKFKQTECVLGIRNTAHKELKQMMKILYHGPLFNGNRDQLCDDNSDCMLFLLYSEGKEELPNSHSSFSVHVLTLVNGVPVVSDVTDFKQRPIVFPSPVYYSVTQCLTLVERSVIHESIQKQYEKLLIIGTLEKQIVVSRDGHVLHVIALDDIPLRMDFVDFGTDSMYCAAKVLIVHLKNEQLKLYDLLDFNLIKTLYDVKQFVVNDFLDRCRDQLLVIYSSNQKCELRDCLLFASINEEFYSIRKERETSPKSNHLYSVLRALHTRYEEAMNQHNSMMEEACEKKRLVQHQGTVLQQITNPSKQQRRQAQAVKQEDMSKKNQLGIYIPFGATTSKSGEITENNRRHGRIDSVEPFDRIEDSNTSVALNMTVLTAHQHLNVDEWRIELAVRITSSIEESSIQCVAFATNCYAHSNVMIRLVDQSTYSIAIVTKTPANLASSNTHLNILLAARCIGNLHDFSYGWLGTIRPTSTQKLLSLQKSNLTFDDNNTASIAEFQILFYKPNIATLDSEESSSTVWQLLHRAIRNQLQMEQIAKQSNEHQSTFQFPNNGTHRITISIFHTQNFVQCTIQNSTDEQYLLVMLQLLMDQLPKSIHVLPMNTHLNMFSDVVRGLLEEIRTAKELKEHLSQNNDRDSTDMESKLINKQIQSDSLMATLVQQTPCKYISYASTL